MCAPGQSVALGNREQRLIVFTLFVTLFLVFGASFNTAGVFFDPLLHQFGWSHAQLSSLQTVLGLTAGASAPIFGWLLDRIEARLVISAGGLLAAIAMLIASLANSFQAMVVAYALLGIAIAAATLLPCSKVLASWFGERRGTALGIVMAGTSLGGMLMTLAAEAAIIKIGWRAGYVVLALPILLVAIPLVLKVVKARPANEALAGSAQVAEAGLEVREALRSRSFWMIAAAQLSFAFAVTGGSLHMVPFLVRTQYTHAHAATVLSLTLGLAAVGKPLMGALADCVSGRAALALAMALTAVGQLVLLGARNPVALAAFIGIYGLAGGAPLALIPDLIAESLGVKRFGTLTGLGGVFTTLGAATGPLAAGWMFDLTGSYVVPFRMFAGILMLGGVAALGCSPLVSPGAPQNQRPFAFRTTAPRRIRAG